MEPMLTRHACRPPFMARVGLCDCSRCCAAAPHEPGCTSQERPDCTCPDGGDYHHPDCPEYEEN